MPETKNENRFHLPPDWRIRRVAHALSQTIDWGDTFLGLPAIWSQTAGEGVNVAILDTGCDVSHPDLQGAIIHAEDFTGSSNGYLDVVQHGTWCAGYIGARNNDIGVCGVANKANLLIGKVLGNDGSGGEQAILAGIQWATQMGADIISMSLGGPMMSDNVRAAIAQFIATPGKFLVAAAGNDGHTAGQDTVGYPAKWPEAVAVAALDQSGAITSFSSCGPEVAVAAPGYNMTSTVPGGYGTMSGTSMATPAVAGVLALMLSMRKKLGLTTPFPSIAQLKANFNVTGKQVAGFSFTGLNPVALLNLVDPTPSPTQPPLIPVPVVTPTLPTTPPSSGTIPPSTSPAMLPFVLASQGYQISMPPVVTDTFSVKVKAS